MRKLVKVRLLNDGWYCGMSEVRFPAVVSGFISGRNAMIQASELERIGGQKGAFQQSDKWVFFIGTECEIIND